MLSDTVPWSAKMMRFVARSAPSDCYYSTTDSPVGPLFLFAESDALLAVLWDLDTESEGQQLKDRFEEEPNHPVLRTAIKQLLEYFEGVRTTFELPLAPIGTPFQKECWMELVKIPYGSTISYGEQAARLGDVRKARAVGGANGCNPISIIIPCHRVVASDGRLRGFGGGLERKATLLKLESSEGGTCQWI